MAYTPEAEKPVVPGQDIDTSEGLVDTGSEKQELSSTLEGYVERVEHSVSSSVANNSGQIVFAPVQDSSSVLQVPVSQEEVTGKQRAPVENSEHWFIAGWRRFVAKAIFAGRKVLYPTHGWGTV